MRPELPPREAFESVLDERLPLALRERRRDARYVFYSMVVDMLEQGSLTWRQRRRLIRFADQVGIDGFEARLLLTGAQFRCGYLRGSNWRDAWMGNGPSHLAPRMIGLHPRDPATRLCCTAAALALLLGFVRFAL